MSRILCVYFASPEKLAAIGVLTTTVQAVLLRHVCPQAYISGPHKPLSPISSWPSQPTTWVLGSCAGPTDVPSTSDILALTISVRSRYASSILALSTQLLNFCKTAITSAPASRYLQHGNWESSDMRLLGKLVNQHLINSVLWNLSQYVRLVHICPGNPNINICSVTRV